MGGEEGRGSREEAALGKVEGRAGGKASETARQQRTMVTTVEFGAAPGRMLPIPSRSRLPLVEGGAAGGGSLLSVDA